MVGEIKKDVILRKDTVNAMERCDGKGQFCSISERDRL